MNQIYNKLRTKRKYVRKPKCKNKLKTCTFEKCRCKPLKIPKRKKPTESQVEELLHRQRVIAVKRREFLQAIDAEIEEMEREKPSIYNACEFNYKLKEKKSWWKQLLEFCSQILP